MEHPKEFAEGLSIGIIMDGNGRWAKNRGLPRTAGHKKGAEVFSDIADYCDELGVSSVYFYAFSTENWKRPKKEVDSILKLLDKYMDECERDMDKYDFRIRFLGDKAAFDEKRRTRMENLEQKTKNRTRTLNIAMNYGGRDEIVHACNRLLASGVRSVDENDFAAALYTAEENDPDLIIRTGGDFRLSNFLLWQAAYAELYFTDVLWPDFGKAELDAAITDFYHRKRRFGGVNKEDK